MLVLFERVTAMGIDYTSKVAMPEVTPASLTPRARASSPVSPSTRPSPRCHRVARRPEHDDGAALERYGFERQPAGWFLEADRPFTSEEMATAGDMAASTRLYVEVRDQQGGLLAAGAIATGTR